MEQRRLLIALGLSLLLLVVYQELVLRRYPRGGRTTPVEAPAPRPEPAPDAAHPAAAAQASALEASPGSTGSLSVDTDVFHAVIARRGGRIMALELKAFRTTVAPDSPALEVVQPGAILPLTLDLGAAGSDAGVDYRSDRDAVSVRGAERGEILLSGEGPQGMRIEKRFAFTGDAYVFELSAEVNGGESERSPGVVLTPLPVQGGDSSGRGVMGIALASRHLVEKPLPDLEKHVTEVGGAVWGGFAAQYFAMVAIPEPSPGSVEMTAAGTTPIVRVGAGSGPTARFTVFAGPKERSVLTAVGHDLDRTLDFGWFWFIAVPLLQALHWIYRVTGNYGVAIIVLTTVVKVSTIPLTRATFRNMREMQKIQPQMAKLRERFKDDQVALQRELMELYKRHKVNPFSGCLPMLLQLPIFVGLYNALSHAIELRHAPFVLWIHDLSVPDRLMVAGWGIPVLTLLMGATMLVQQWMTPQQGDPAQQRMMMFMPLIFTYMFINFPAGLVLYWLVNNVLTIGQQFLMMRSST